MPMKALKSAFAKSLLKDPESARALREALPKAGYGPQNGVTIAVYPARKDGQRSEPVQVNLHYVHKA